MPKNFLDEFNKHLKNFALTERSLWIIDAMREKMSKEKQMLAENDKET